MALPAQLVCVFVVVVVVVNIVFVVFTVVVAVHIGFSSGQLKGPYHNQLSFYMLKHSFC